MRRVLTGVGGLGLQDRAEGKHADDDGLGTPKEDVSSTSATEASVSRGDDAPAVGASRGKVTDAYSMGKVIGSGSYSVVREGVHKRSKEKFAIKCIKRSELTDEDDEAIMTEVAILQQMKHANIMTLKEFFVEPEYYYLVTEFVGGGELFDRIVEKVGCCRCTAGTVPNSVANCG
jgi:calcium/calmodulin-dependent protein kinase I